MLTARRKFEQWSGTPRASALINGRNYVHLAWKLRYIGIFTWIKEGVKCFMKILSILWLCTRLKYEYSPNNTTLNGIVIDPELSILSENLCCIWFATRDFKQRKFNYPLNYRYGLNLNIDRKPSHVFLLVLLAGDVAINPGPVSSCLSKTSTGIKVLYLNARSLKAFVPLDESKTNVCKIALFQQLVQSSIYDVVCVCETWLNDSVLDSELLQGYNIFRRDRVGRVGGGVLVATKSNIRATRRLDLEKNEAEFVVIELVKPNNKSVLLYTLYRPPDSTADALQHLNTSLQNTSESSCCVVVGDFNLPAIDWSTDCSAPINKGEGVIGNVFCDLVGDNFLSQLIEGPTHKAGNTLDLLLCNCPEVIDEVNKRSPEECDFPTDRLIIDFNIRFNFQRIKSAERQVYNFKKADFQGLGKTLSQMTFDINNSSDIDELWSSWKNSFLSAVNNHIPKKIIKDTNSLPWVDKEVHHLIRKKYSALKKYRQNKCETRKQKLRELSNSVKSLVKKKHKEYLSRIEKSFATNPKLFWTYHKAILHSRSNQSSDITYNGVTAKSSAEKAELLNSYFSSVFTTSSTENEDHDGESFETVSKLGEIQVEVDEVEFYLRNLDITKASGPDKIPARLLKECYPHIAPSLCKLFNMSLRVGRLPAEWKAANVTPIHKKGLKEPAENYRPISLLPIIAKTLERCVCRRLHEHVFKAISPRQHGFLRNRSCTTQMLQVLHKIGENLDNNIQTDIIYLDFAKAFDSVDHGLILEKLRQYGVHSNILNWFANYLNDRTQRVVVDDVASGWSSVTSGVPQGSILGPMLFVLFINDLPDVIPEKTEAALYADDTKTFRKITSEDDAQQLQQTLSSLDSWSNTNNIKFNASKCKVLTVSRKKQPIHFTYQLGSTTLSRVEEEKDLGIKMTGNLSWESHIHEITAKANKLLGLLKRTCPFLTDVRVRRTLYLSLVKSQLSYACEVWSPHIYAQKIKIERVQRRATRWILKARKGDSSYSERLSDLKLLPLCYDREIKDLTFFYKTLYGISDLNVHDYVSFVTHNRSRLCCNPNLILKTPFCKTTTYQNSYFNRIVKLWNSVCKVAPPNTFSSVKTFKHYLLNYYSMLVSSVYDVNLLCTWSISRECPCHRS